MQSVLNKLLFGVALSLVTIDTLWVVSYHISIDARNYLLLLFLVLPLAAGALFYDSIRRDAPLSAALACAGFLLVFSASCSLLSYLLMTISGSRIDLLLARIDEAMGFHWIAVMEFAATHKLFTGLLGMAYLSVMPQIAILILILGWKKQLENLYGLCLAIAIGGIIAVCVWAIHPAFGAFSVFNLSPKTAESLGLALNGDYGRDLVLMLKNGPGRISPSELRGVVGFPSYHTVQAIVLMWYSRNLKALSWFVFALNLAVICATPIHGGHDLIDVIAGAVVSIAAIASADFAVRRAKKNADAGAPASDLVASHAA